MCTSTPQSLESGCGVVIGSIGGLFGTQYCGGGFLDAVAVSAAPNLSRCAQGALQGISGGDAYGFRP